MADEVDGNVEKRTVKKRKRSRHWDDEETRKLVLKWAEDNIQERLKSCTRKKKIWEEISLYMKACGYEDRDGDSCKTRLHTLTSAYRNYLDNRRDTTGTAPGKKPPCFDELDEILSDKPTTFPKFLKSSTGNNVMEDQQDTSCSDVDDSIELRQLIGKNESSHEESFTNDLNNSNEIEMEVTFEDQPFSSASKIRTQKSFCFPKSNKRKTSNQAMLEMFNSSMNTFMSSQAEADREFMSNFLSQDSTTTNNEATIVIKIRTSGDFYFIETDLLKSELSFEKLAQKIKEEFQLAQDVKMIITKLPNMLVRNDRDVKRLKSGDEIEFSLVEQYS